MLKEASLTYFVSLLLLFKEVFYLVIRYHFFFKSVRVRFIGLHHFDYFGVSLTFSFLKCCYCFLCHVALLYLISLWTVIFFKIGLYFFNSKRSGVFFLFFVVMYLEVPGFPLSLCSVHSMITWILFPFLAIVPRFNYGSANLDKKFVSQNRSFQNNLGWFGRWLQR